MVAGLGGNLGLTQSLHLVNLGYKASGASIYGAAAFEVAQGGVSDGGYK